MKRLGDDVYAAASQFKQPSGSSSGGSDGQSQIPGGEEKGGSGLCGTSLKLTTTDAFNYLKEVKGEFRYQREKYDMFLKLMRDFKDQIIGTHHVTAAVKELFKGHNNLISGFNTFLPKGYKIILDDNDNDNDDEAPPPKMTAESEEAISFENKIKEYFQNDGAVYKAFLGILDSYRKEHKDINEVYIEVAILFDGHPDLLDEFKRFLPNDAPHLQISFKPLNGRSQMHMDKARIITSNADPDLSVDHPEL